VAAPLAAYLGLQRPARRDAVLAAGFAALAVLLCLGPADEFEQLERAWVVLLTASLAIVLIGTRVRGYAASSLLAVAGSGGAAGILMLITRLTWGKVAGLVEHHYFLQARTLVDLVAPVGNPARETVNEALLGGIHMLSGFLPGLVLLQSLAALALAWALYHRFAREPRSEPLGPLALFRFNDHLIWGVALSLLVVLLPRLSWARALGGNLLVFFGGLYLVRGVAVLAAVAAAVGFTGLLAYVVMLLFTVFLMPVVAVTALALGLTDTLVDWRMRLARAVPKP
jgi:Predicted membrane protein (DUF2232)